MNDQLDISIQQQGSVYFLIVYRWISEKNKTNKQQTKIDWIYTQNPDINEGYTPLIGSSASDNNNNNYHIMTPVCRLLLSLLTLFKSLLAVIKRALLSTCLNDVLTFFDAVPDHGTLNIFFQTPKTRITE